MIRGFFLLRCIDRSGRDSSSPGHLDIKRPFSIRLSFSPSWFDADPSERRDDNPFFIAALVFLFPINLPFSPSKLRGHFFRQNSDGSFLGLCPPLKTLRVFSPKDAFPLNPYWDPSGCTVLSPWIPSFLRRINQLLSGESYPSF